ncbi:HEXXH motif domain-containing protein [Parafrankia sp. EUN1f]|uniref:HEXXH motif domain-containing protein n=1 Tax=Parafrankia sp. EUN1f TaxID=102897 RepID=UPI0001C46BA3|nr:HEXXH motif domain-containing protein [Parafrankia sp. EUN1f]EFC82653.1 hypothetical protein FrEUN1fDRAFT_4226 [Parafrankia sp. EUN1f]
MNVGLHRLALADFDDLASGGGRADLVRYLRKTQFSKRLLVLRAVLEDVSRHAPEEFFHSGLADAFRILSAAQRRDPGQIENLLLTPGIGLWAMHCMRRIRGTVTSAVPLAEDLSMLAAFAVAAALRTGLDAEARVFLQDGDLLVPSLGRIRTGRPGWAVARVEGGEVTIRGCGVPGTTPTTDVIASAEFERRDHRWLPLRTLTSSSWGQEIQLALDDTDPARMLLDLPMSPGVAEEEIDTWQHRLDEGWHILCCYGLPAAGAIAAGLRSVYPLLSTDQATELSASSAEAFGAIALTLPKDGVSFAAGLVHEFQHTKLSALIDLVALTDPAHDRLYYAPWRSDPRPVTGLLQGAYAYLGLTTFWDFRRSHPEGPAYAHFEFARWREEVWRVLSTLRLSGAMTPLGLRFLDGMRVVVARHREAAVPATLRTLAELTTADTWITWRLRNLQPAPARIAALARAWIDQGIAPQDEVPSRPLPGHRGLVYNQRLALTLLRLTDPKRFEAARQGVPHVLDASVTAADQALAFGDATSAAACYKAELARDPEQLDAWAGLALCRRASGRPGADILTARPEVVLHLRRQVQELTGDPADPDALAAWMSRSSR